MLRQLCKTHLALGETRESNTLTQSYLGVMEVIFQILAQSHNRKVSILHLLIRRPGLHVRVNS